MIKNALLFLIDFYRNFLSFDKGVLSYFAPGGACRQLPSCSLYIREMILEKGVIKGLKLGFLRIINCR